MVTNHRPLNLSEGLVGYLHFPDMIEGLGGWLIFIQLMEGKATREQLFRMNHFVKKLVDGCNTHRMPTGGGQLQEFYLELAQTYLESVLRAADKEVLRRTFVTDAGSRNDVGITYYELAYGLSQRLSDDTDQRKRTMDELGRYVDVAFEMLQQAP